MAQYITQKELLTIGGISPEGSKWFNTLLQLTNGMAVENDDISDDEVQLIYPDDKLAESNSKEPETNFERLNISEVK